MSTSVISNPAPSQAAAPAAITLAAPGAATAPDAIDLPGTGAGGGSESPSTGVVPIETPDPAASPTVLPLDIAGSEGDQGVIPIDTPEQAPPPETVPVAVSGADTVPLVNQTQLSQTVSQLTALVEAGTKPVITKPDGSKVELTIDETDTLEQEPIE